MRKEPMFYIYLIILIAAGLFLIMMPAIIRLSFPSRIAEVIGAAMIVAGFTTALHDYILYQRVTYRYFRLLEGTGKSDILNIYPQREEAVNEIKRLIPSIRSEIIILGISHTDLIYDGKFRKNINEFFGSNIKIRALFLDKDSDAARERAKREEGKEEIKDTQLYIDLENCEKFYTDLKKTLDKENSILKLEWHQYNSQPSFFLVIIDDMMFFEPYHLGKEKEEEAPFARCLGKRVPVLQVDKRARVFKIMKSHFEYLWKQLENQATLSNRS